MDIHNPLGLTDAQLRATAVPISGTVAVTGAGDASAANQATQIARADTLNAKDFATQTTLAALNTKVPAQGAAVVAGSLPVTIATNQTAIPISAATLPLPSGAAQEATLQTISGQLGGTLSTAIIGTPTVQITSQPIQISSAAGALATEATAALILANTALKTCKSAVVNLLVTGTVVAAVASKRIKVYAIQVICSAALTINFRSGGATALEGPQPIVLSGGKTIAVNPPNFLFGTVAGESLDLVITGIGTVAGVVSYFDDDVA